MNTNQNTLIKVLDFAYNKAVNGIPGLGSAQEMAEDYLRCGGQLSENVDSLISWQVAKASTSGFLTGLGGVISMPITIPANISSILYIQIRMIAAVAYMGGYDLQDDRVKTLVYMCMAGNGVKDLAKNLSMRLGEKLTYKTINNISGKTILEINKKIGFKLLTKFGEKGVINLGKMLPILGGLIGGTFDGVTTKSIGVIAKITFAN